MADLKGKVKNALNEGRTLVLGAQVLIGFQYQSIFQKSFEKLPEITQYLKVSGLGLLLIALALLMWPVAYHRIVEKGEDTQQFHDFVTCAISPALLPFAIALGIDLYIAGEKLGGQKLGIICGIAGAVVAKVFRSVEVGIMAAVYMLLLFLGLWFGYTLVRKAQREKQPASVPQVQPR
jgi:protein-S-isoprenylcysteine O-methyltransferase Ste14